MNTLAPQSTFCCRRRWRWNQFVSAPIKGQVGWICFLIWYTHSGKRRLKVKLIGIILRYFILLRTSNKILLAAQLLKLFFTRRALTDQFSAEWTSKFLRLTIVNVSSIGTCELKKFKQKCVGRQLWENCECMRCCLNCSFVFVDETLFYCPITFSRHSRSLLSYYALRKVERSGGKARKVYPRWKSCGNEFDEFLKAPCRSIKKVIRGWFQGRAEFVSSE